MAATAEETKTTGLTGHQKAAILMVTLGEKLGAEILKQLNEDEVKLVSKAIARLDKVTPDQTEAVLEEFCTATMGYAGRGGVEYAKRVLSNAFGTEGAKRIAQQLPSDNRPNKEIESLQKADPEQLGRFLSAEHPQTIAMILSHLTPQQAAVLVERLPAELRADVIVRMAELDSVSPDVVARISIVIADKMRSFGEMRTRLQGGPRAVAEILNRMDSTVSEEILNTIQDHQPLADAIRHFMFVFEDLLLLDSNGLKELLAKIDRKLLVIALKGTSDRLRDHMMTCMSSRAAEMLREDMEAAGPVKIRDVEAAQYQILTVVQQLEGDGLLNRKGGGGDEYVN